MAPPQKERIGENRQRMQDIDKLGEFSSLNAFPSLEKIDSDDTDVSSGKRKDEQFEQDSKYELTNITSSFEENERKKELKGWKMNHTKIKLSRFVNRYSFGDVERQVMHTKVRSRSQSVPVIPKDVLEFAVNTDGKHARKRESKKTLFEQEPTSAVNTKATKKESMTIMLKGHKREDSNKQVKYRNRKRMITLWEQHNNMLDEVDVEKIDDLKRRRVVHFLLVPWEIEKLMTLGIAVCAASMVKTLVTLPAKAFLGATQLLKGATVRIKSKINNKNYVIVWPTVDRVTDLAKFSILGLACIVVGNIDAAKVYHTIRAQSTLKLYFIFNTLELFDKLLSSLGLDIIDSLHISVGEYYNDNEKHKRTLFTFVGHLILSFLYVTIHSLVLYYQILTLNVAINSYSQQLVSLLISNQFVELKGNILKRFEKENLFQLTCGDIVERFQEIIILSLIFFRNFIEMNEYQITGWNINAEDLFTRLLVPVFMILGTELLVDWVKHAYITKFNWIRPQVYEKYGHVLCRDLVDSQHKDDLTGPSVPVSASPEASSNKTFDHVNFVAKKIGFIPLPLLSVLLLMTFQSISLILGPFSSPLKTLLLFPKMYFYYVFSAISVSYHLVTNLVSPTANFALFCINTTVSIIANSHTYLSLKNIITRYIFMYGHIDEHVVFERLATIPHITYGSISYIAGYTNRYYNKAIGLFRILTPPITDGEMRNFLGFFYFTMLIILVYVIFSLVNLYSSYLLKRYALNRYLSYTKKPNEPTTVPLSASISNSSNSSKTGHTSTIRNYDRDRNHSSNTVASINTNKSDVVPEILVNNKPIGSQKPQNTENFDDETKGVDVGRLKGIASFISNDAEDKKWESFKPKYTLDNVTRYSLVKSRIP